MNILKELKRGYLKKEEKMIDFNEEIAKFKPCLEIEEAEEIIYAYRAKDIDDIVREIVKEVQREGEK